MVAPIEDEATLNRLYRERGDALLMGYWKDPDVDPGECAFYYVRVIEIPTPCWTAYDARRFGVEMPEGVTMTGQDGAYTSRISYPP